MSGAFVDRWMLKATSCGIAHLGKNMVACGSTILPIEAAPCLTFAEAAHPVPICELFGSPRDWTPADRERLSGYRVIGLDGAGNPLCVENGSGTVWLLDHEDRFRTRQYVNGSVSQLAECLLAYLGEQQPERFRSAVWAIDPAALDERSFWWHEAAGLDAETG